MNKHEIELDLLSSMIIHPDKYGDIFLARVKKEDFGDKRHQAIYQGIELLYKNNMSTFDFSWLSATYPKALDAMGGIDYLAELLTYSIHHDVKSKIDALIKCNTVLFLQNIYKEAKPLFDEDFNKGITFVEQRFNDTIDRVSNQSSVDLYSSFKQHLSEGEKIRIDFGMPSVHKMLGFPHPGELMIIGARPGMGKTAFALNLLFNYIHNPNSKRALMFSLEMSGIELFNRLISMVSALPLSELRAGGLEPRVEDILDKNAKELASNTKLQLYDKSVNNISALRSAIRKEQKKGEVGLVVIDYLQLLSGTGNSLYEKVSEISRQLKLIARDFNVCVVALSQLSRKVEERADKHPQLSDLRESGSIEQDADYVLFLYRDNYYTKDPSIDPHDDTIEVDISKNRHGSTGKIALPFDLTIGKIKESDF